MVRACRMIVGLVFARPLGHKQQNYKNSASLSLLELELPSSAITRRFDFVVGVGVAVATVVDGVVLGCQMTRQPPFDKPEGFSLGSLVLQSCEFGRTCARDRMIEATPQSGRMSPVNPAHVDQQSH